MANHLCVMSVCISGEYFWVAEVYGISPPAADDTVLGPDCDLLPQMLLVLQYTSVPLIYMGLAVLHEEGGGGQ